MESVFQDIRFAFRALRMGPGFTLVAILTLAIGIGANTAVFSIVRAVLLRPLPYPHPEQLVYIWERDGTVVPESTASIPDVRDWQSQASSFAAMGYFFGGHLTISISTEPQFVDALRTSASYFDVFSVRPELGRTYTPDEERFGNHHVVVLSHALWQQAFGADPNAIGRSVTINAQPFTIIGVMPASFYPLQARAQAWVPLSFPADTPIIRDDRFLTVIARLKDGVSHQQASAEMATIANRMSQQYHENQNVSAYLVDMHDQVARDVRPAVLILLGAVTLVLLIACANIANLLLERAAARQREIAIRISMGASGLRIARQLITESVVLGTIGAIAGVTLASWIITILRQTSDHYLPPVYPIQLDLGVLLFTAAVTVLASVGFGLAPAIRAARADVNESLKACGSTVAGGASRLKGSFVVSEVGFAVMLLSGAGLLLASLQHMQMVDPGFNTRGAASARIVLPSGKYKDDKDRRAFYEQLTERLAAMPGMSAAGATQTLPLGAGDRYWTDVSIFGREVPTTMREIVWYQTTPGYFDAMGMALKRGRNFTRDDDMKRPLVAIISEKVAKRQFGSENPLGRQFRFGMNPDPKDAPITIIGVVADTPVDALNREIPASVYTPHQQGGHGSSPDMVVVARSATSTVAMQAIRDAVRAADKDLAVSSAATLEDVVSDSMRSPRLLTRLLGCFAGVAALLAIVGLYGVLAYGVAQRRREIGVRMALGATSTDILGLIVGSGVKLVALGIVVGVMGTLLASQALKTLLFGVGSGDPRVIGGVAIGLATVGIVASYFPAWRATKIDPLVALRYE